jgi:hypothetical protein
MSVPNHGPFCQSKTYPVKCWDCGKQIYIFQCTCGSTVLFDRLGSPWPIHDCGGEKLPTGWDAIRKLQSMGVPIDQRVMEYAFGKKPKRPSNAPPPIIRVDPVHGEVLDIIAILREYNDTTKVVNSIKEFGTIGLQILGLKNDQKVAQITFHDTSKSQAESYTCLMPLALSVNKSDIGKLIGVSLRGVVSGSMSYWIVSNIDVFKA